MIKNFFNNLIYRRYRRLIRKRFEPEKKFLEETRKLFLIEAAKKRGELPVPTSSPIGYIFALRYVFAAIALFIFSAGGLIAYADTRDVPPGDVLYNLKRLGENIQLNLAFDRKLKDELYREFAQRRLKEIKIVKIEEQSFIGAPNQNFTQPNERKEEGTAIEEQKSVDNFPASGNAPAGRGESEREQKGEKVIRELHSDFAKKAEVIEEEIDQHNFSESGIVDLCKSAYEAGVAGRKNNSDQLKKFWERCGNLEVSDGNGDNFGGKKPENDKENNKGKIENQNGVNNEPQEKDNKTIINIGNDDDKSGNQKSESGEDNNSGRGH